MKPYVSMLMALLAVSVLWAAAAPQASWRTPTGLRLSTIPPGQGFTVTVDGDPSDWPPPSPLHGPVSIDGHIGDWESVDALYYNAFNVSMGEFVWRDAPGDLRSTNTSDVDADILELHVSSNATHLLFMVKLRDLGVVGDPDRPSIAVLIPIDVDMNPSNGATYLAYNSETQVSDYAHWDYQIVVDLTNPAVAPYHLIRGDGVEVWNGGSPLDIYDPGFNDVSTPNSSFAVGLFENSVEIAVAWSDLGVENPWNVSNIRVYTATVKSNGYGEALEVDYGGGSDVLDAVSNQTTDDEVADGVIDYWLDIGLNRVPEPTSYRHSVLEEDGLAVSWLDYSHDERRDYIPSEAFDTDLVEAAIKIDKDTGNLYILVHIRGYADATGDIYPAVVFVIDTTPEDPGDGEGPWIYAPPGWGNTDTELAALNGTPANWTHLLWINPRFTNTWLYSSDTAAWTPTGTAVFNGHFIEASLSYSLIDPDLHAKRFRIEVLCYAYAARPVQYDVNDILGTNTPLYSSNAYDIVSPLATWSAGGAVNFTGVNGEFYDDDNEINATRYDYATDTNEDHWVDTYTLKKYGVRIRNVTVSFSDYDNDTYLEIGEPAKITGFIEYYDGDNWVPLDNYTAGFAFIGSYYYLGENRSANGSLVFYAPNPADTIPTGTYRALIYTNETSLFYEASGVSNNTVEIIQRPYIPTVAEPPLLAVAAAAALLAAALTRRRR